MEKQASFSLSPSLVLSGGGIHFGAGLHPTHPPTPNALSAPIGLQRGGKEPCSMIRPCRSQECSFTLHVSRCLARLLPLTSRQSSSVPITYLPFFFCEETISSSQKKKRKKVPLCRAPPLGRPRDQVPFTEPAVLQRVMDRRTASASPGEGGGCV